MTVSTLVLDHVALVAPDLDTAQETYTRMGFSLSPRSSHKGRETPDGPVVTWGTGNHCAMFDSGYFEILGITDANKKCDHVRGLLDNHCGLHLIALGCEDTETEAKLLRERLGKGEDPYRMSRDVPLPGGKFAQATFSILHLPDGTFPQADLFLIKHHDADVIWHPDTLGQPNGVTELLEVTVCAEDVGATAGRLAAVLGISPHENSLERIFDLQRGSIRIVAPDSLGQRYPGINSPAISWVAGVKFAVRDLHETRNFLERRSFDVQRRAVDSIWISPDQADGAVVEFVQAVI